MEVDARRRLGGCARAWPAEAGKQAAFLGAGGGAENGEKRQRLRRGSERKLG